MSFDTEDRPAPLTASRKGSLLRRGVATALLASTALLSACSSQSPRGSSPPAASSATDSAPTKTASAPTGSGTTASADNPGDYDPGGSDDGLGNLDGPSDPFENVNRFLFKVNMTADKYVMKPIAKGYRTVVPNFVRRRIDNVLTNLDQPLVVVNDMLQGNPRRIAESFDRLWMNSILGLGGMFDVATSFHVPQHDADFGQTLGVWGIGSGPYLVLPLLGPSDPRDAIGYGVDSYGDPFGQEMSIHNMDYASYTRTGMGILNDRTNHLDDLDELQRSSLDFYAALRSLYWQHRQAEIAEARASLHKAWNPGP